MSSIQVRWQPRHRVCGAHCIRTPFHSSKYPIIPHTSFGEYIRAGRIARWEGKNRRGSSAPDANPISNGGIIGSWPWPFAIHGNRIRSMPFVAVALPSLEIPRSLPPARYWAPDAVRQVATSGGPCNGRLVNIQTPPQGGTYVFNVHTRVWSRPMSCGPGNAPTSSTICRSKNKHGQISRIKTRRVTDQMIGVSSALTTTILPGRPREERSSRTSRDDVLALRVRR